MTREWRAGVSCLIIGIAGVIVAHAIWLSHDDRPARWDEVRFSAATRSLLGQDGRTRIAGVSSSPYPPAYPALGALAAKVTGKPDAPVTRWVNVPLAVISALLTFLIARPLLPVTGAAWCALLAASLPAGFAGAHLYLSENLLVPLVLAVWVIAWPSGSPAPLSRGRGLLLGVILGLGCLTKWTFPLYVGLPVLVFARRSPRVGLVALATGVVICGWWYVEHHRDVVDHLERGILAGDWAWVSARPWWWYARSIVYAGLGIPLAAVVVTGTIWLPRSGWGLLCGALLPIGVLSFVHTKQMRHLLPVMPLLPVVAGLALWRCRWVAWRRVAAFVVFAHVGVAAGLASFAEGPQMRWNIGIARIPCFALPEPPGAPDATSWPLDEVLTAATAEVNGTPRVYVACAATPLTAEGLDHVAGRSGWSVELYEAPLWFPPGHARRRPFPVSPLLDAHRIVTKSGRSHDRLSAYVPDLQQWGVRLNAALLDPASPFGGVVKRVATIAWPDGTDAIVLDPGPPERLRRAIVAWFLEVERLDAQPR
ncbi:MAG: hypothetical protein CMJ83_18670 [Planctomycetes bacterium]|nr:hypothetical protein [Planctomycetota bacterium]